MAVNDTGVPHGLVTEDQIAQMAGLDVAQVRLMMSGAVPVPPHLDGVIPKPATQFQGYVWREEDVAGLGDRVREAQERHRAELAAQAQPVITPQLPVDLSAEPDPEPSTRVSGSVFEFQAEREQEREDAATRLGGYVDRESDSLLPVARTGRKVPRWLAGIRSSWQASAGAAPAEAVALAAPSRLIPSAPTETTATDAGDGHIIVTSGSNSRRSRDADRENFAAQRANERAARAQANAEEKGRKRAEKQSRRAVVNAPAPAPADDSTDFPSFEDLVADASPGVAGDSPLVADVSKADLKRADREAKAAARAEAKAEKASKEPKPEKAPKGEKSPKPEKAAKVAKVKPVKPAKPSSAEVKAAKTAAAELKKRDAVDAKAAKATRTRVYKEAIERWKLDSKVAKENGTRPPRKPKRPKNDTSKPKPIDITNSVRALATMLENSPGELESLKVMAREYEGTQIGEAFRRIANRVSDDNASMVEAFAPETVFPIEVHNMLAVGQKTIAPGPALRTAVKLMDASSDAKRKLKSEIVEPASVGLLSLVALFATAYGVMPSFVEMYNSLEMEVPPVSAAILVMSDVVVWVLATVFGAAIVYFIWWFAYGRKWDRWRTWLDAYSLHMPLMGDANMTQQTYQLLKVLGAYITVGAPEREALVDAAAATKNRAIKKHLLTTAELMMAGRRTFAATFDADMFPSMCRNILGIGEQAGRVQEAIVDLEGVYEREAEVASQQAVAKVSGTVAGISSLIFTVVVTMVTVPPLEMFGSTLSYGQ